MKFGDTCLTYNNDSGNYEILMKIITEDHGAGFININYPTVIYSQDYIKSKNVEVLKTMSIENFLKYFCKEVMLKEFYDIATTIELNNKINAVRNLYIDKKDEVERVKSMLDNLIDLSDEYGFNRKYQIVTGYHLNDRSKKLFNWVADRNKIADITKGTRVVVETSKGTQDDVIVVSTLDVKHKDSSLKNVIKIYEEEVI